jgi:phage terminase large subunit
MASEVKSKTLVIEPPNEKQKLFFLADRRFVAYGGARGGGKSWAVRRKAELLALNYPGIRILFLRRTLKELRENHLDTMRVDLSGIATFREVDAKFTFYNGSTIKMGYCDNEKDVLQYQGQEYDIIFLDEATQFTEWQFLMILSCLRGANDFPKRFYLTCNPGGVGHAWVKRLFIDRDYREGEDPDDYVFIQAKLSDNKVLMETDPAYAQMLDRLPPDIRRAWRDGDWNVFLGQYFPEFGEHHVEDLQRPPKSWARYAALDYGLDALAFYQAAVEPNGRIHVYREIYATGKLIREAAQLIKAGTFGDLGIVYAPPDLWNRRQDTGKSVADIFAEEGVYLVRVSNDRITGWLEVKERLQIGEDGRPGILFDRNCRNVLKSFPLLLSDEKHIGDVATEPHEYTHGPDAIRYLLAGRPRPGDSMEELEEERMGEEELESWMDYGR